MPDPVLLTVDAIREAHPILVDAKYSDELIEGLVSEFVDKYVEFRGVHPITKTSVSTVRVDRAGARRLLLRPMLQEITSVTDLDGDPVGVTATIEDEVLGTVLLAPPLTAGSYLVEMVHGYEDPLPGALRACGLFVRREAQAQLNPATGNSFLRSNAELGVVERDSSQSMADNRPTGWIDVDRILNGCEDFRSEP